MKRYCRKKGYSGRNLWKAIFCVREDSNCLRMINISDIFFFCFIFLSFSFYTSLNLSPKATNIMSLFILLNSNLSISVIITFLMKILKKKPSFIIYFATDRHFLNLLPFKIPQIHVHRSHTIFFRKLFLIKNLANYISF